MSLPLVCCVAMAAGCDLPHLQRYSVILNAAVSPTYSCAVSDVPTVSYDLCGDSGMIAVPGSASPAPLVISPPPPPNVGLIGSPDSNVCPRTFLWGSMPVSPSAGLPATLSLTASSNGFPQTDPPFLVSAFVMNPGDTFGLSFLSADSPNCASPVRFDPAVYSPNVVLKSVFNHGEFPVLLTPLDANDIPQRSGFLVSPGTSTDISMPLGGSSWQVVDVAPGSCSTATPRILTMAFGC